MNNIKENIDSPKARGERLRRLRNMANLSREELCNTETLNSSTYKGWETGRFAGLSISGAKEVIKRVAKEGVICSLDWLLYNRGTGPFVAASAFSSAEGNSDRTNAILQELTVFQNNFKDAIFLEILDDTTFPLYSSGDYVAGVKKYAKEIDSLVGQLCIIQTDNNEILVRTLLKGTSKKLYTLACANLNTTTDQPILSDIKINAAASIIRHYKK